MVISLYLSGVIGAGYQLTPDDAQDFSERVSRMVTRGRSNPAPNPNPEPEPRTRTRTPKPKPNPNPGPTLLSQA